MRKILISVLLATAAASPAFAAQDQSTNRQRADGVSRWTRDTVQQPGDTTRWTRDPLQRTGETERWTRDRVGNGTSAKEAEQADQSQPPLSEQGGSRPRKTTQSHAQNRNASWNKAWRNDARYDWHRYREHHRSVFRLRAYVDPFGFGYRSFNVGYTLGPAYYGQQYWIDPSIYSLPYPPPGTQWVRYWNDALLVDIYSGQVVDVVHNFFW